MPSATPAGETARLVEWSLRGGAIVLPAVTGGIGLAAPTSILGGGAAWLVFLTAAVAGWGHVVARAARTEGDLGLRLAWGTAALLAVAGVFLALGGLDRLALGGLSGVGFAAYAWRQWTSAEPAALVVGRGVARLRADPQAALVWMVIASVVLLNVLGAVASQRANPYDDDICYTPFVRRLLDAGDLIEPFSFRRLSAFGGQTVLSALAAVRGSLANIYLVDHGLCQLITIALMVGLLRARGVDRLIGALLVLVVALMPDASINTASYWSGAALFLALYRTVAEAAVDAPRRLALAGLVAAAACTLRQNYLPVAIGFLALVLVFRIRRPIVSTLRADRRLWLAALVGGLVGLAAYLVASWRSNETFLYPFQLGTFNPHIRLIPTVWTGWQELRFVVSVVLDPDPVRVVVPLLPLLLVCRDRRPGRPLLALVLGSAVGFLLMCHAFSLADARNLWRYAFGYALALTVVIVVEASASPTAEGDAAPPSLPALGRFWVVACLLAQLVLTGKSTARKYRVIGDSVVSASRGGAGEARAVAAAYRQLQAAVPAGATLVVMLDEPVYLDYARNRIINLDTPGHASYRPGMPAFRGAEAVAGYLRAHGLRYLAFVRTEQSRYFYRRAFWVQRILIDVEIWRIVGAYMVDTIDNFAELAERYPTLYDQEGMVVVDLAAPREAAR